jgi:signal transduction histidine kinase
MPIGLFILGLMSIGVLIWSSRLGERQGLNSNLADALADAQMEAATFHLWLDEHLLGDADEDVERVWESIDSAIGQAETILSGGKSQFGLTLEPLADPRLRTEVEEIKALLTSFKAIGQDRFRQADTAGPDPALEREFDRIFMEFLKKARAVEVHVEQGLVASQAQLKRVSLGLLIAWTFIVLAATSGLWTREHRRKAAEEALQATNEQLQSQAGELIRHRLHLLELVGERTAELTDANRELQLEVIERRRAVEALQESKDKFEKLSREFHTLLDAIPDALTLLSPELKVMWANRGAESLFGRPISEILGRPCCELWNNRSTPREDCPAVRAFHSGRSENIEVSAPDGSTRDTRVFPIWDMEGRVYSVIEIATDVTERRILQAEAQRVAHLASLGELAAGVAHEINNPINGIINYAQILIDDRGRTDEESEFLDQIIKEGDRIATIVRSLLSFAHENKAEKMPVHIHDILSDTLALSGRQLEKDGIKIKLRIPDRLPAILANHQQIEQVFLNIMSNARYALNQKYQLCHDLKIIDISAQETDTYGMPGVSILFHDLGTGIPTDIIDRVTDPFFSTKPKDLGTGLGLSISHGIISDHNGNLNLQSVEGKFTKVQVILPIGENNGGKNPCN